MEGRIQIDRFKVTNFRSIQECDVELAPLTFFIGPNASGKTSFVDAMLFVASALRTSLQKAAADRGGIHSILHQPITLPCSMRFELYLSGPIDFACDFKLELRVVEGWSVSVAREECRIRTSGGEHSYLVEKGGVIGTAAVFPAVSTDRVFLSNASGLPEFRLLFNFLSGIGLTEPTPGSVHNFVQQLDRRVRILSPGSEYTGVAARIRDLASNHPDRLEIIQQYLRAIAPPFDRVEVFESGNSLWLRFVDKSNSGTPSAFYISQTSNGLVNATEVLLELFEFPGEAKQPSPVIIEEPEAFLHPGAIQVIRDSFLEASATRQVLVTTHSPDLLDDPDVPAEWIRTVYRDNEGTHIDVLDEATKSIIRDRLYTPGQLLPQGGLVSKS